MEGEVIPEVGKFQVQRVVIRPGHAIEFNFHIGNLIQMVVINKLPVYLYPVKLHGSRGLNRDLKIIHFQHSKATKGAPPYAVSTV
ncbi:hypothetical protein ES705_41382 [subsurface metagenome]